MNKTTSRLFAGMILDSILQESRIRNQNAESKRPVDPDYRHIADKLNAEEEKLRGTGRSTNQALTYVRAAIDAAGTPVTIRDHFPSEKAHAELTEKVSRILSILNVDHSAVGTKVMVAPLVKPEPDEALPEWASAANPEHVLGEAAQLCTKDGRRIGNAFIVSMPSPFVEDGSFCVETDAGNHLHMKEAEIHELFNVGDFFGKIDEILARPQRD